MIRLMMCEKPPLQIGCGSLGTRPFALRGMVWFHCNIAFVLDTY